MASLSRTPQTVTTAERADAHEALTLKIAKLVKQVEALAARRPDAIVARQVRATAEALLFEAEAFRPSGGRTARPHPPALTLRGSKGLPAVADEVAGVAVQLGQALAALEHWEGARSAWSDDHKCFVWLLGGDEVLPIRRLRPESGAILRAVAEGGKLSPIKEKLLRLIDAKWGSGYEAGYRDAAEGLPNQERETKSIPARDGQG